MRKLSIIGYTMLFAATPVAAAATADIAGSRVDYITDLKIRTGDKYHGPSTGHARVCADQTGSVVGHGGSLAWVIKDVPKWPDQTVSGVVVEGGRPVACGSLGATSTQAWYYTKVQASFDNARGWALARKL